MVELGQQMLREFGAFRPLSTLSTSLSTLSIYVGPLFAERALGVLRKVFAAASLSYRPQYAAANGLIERGERYILCFLQILNYPLKTAATALSLFFFIFALQLSHDKTVLPTSPRPRWRRHCG